VYFGLVLAGLIHGLPREEVLAPDWDEAAGREVLD